VLPHRGPGQARAGVGHAQRFAESSSGYFLDLPSPGILSASWPSWGRLRCSVCM
jgi:hypothetical protein